MGWVGKGSACFGELVEVDDKLLETGVGKLTCLAWKHRQKLLDSVSLGCWRKADRTPDSGQRVVIENFRSRRLMPSQPAQPSRQSCSSSGLPVAQSAAILLSLPTNGWMGPATRLLHSGPISDASGLLRSTGTYITDYMTLHM